MGKGKKKRKKNKEKEKTHLNQGEHWCMIKLQDDHFAKRTGSLQQRRRQVLCEYRSSLPH